MEKISAVYKIVNEVTGDFYIGSSKNVKQRWAEHKCLSSWKRYPNSPMYQDMKKHGVENFRFQILAPVMEEHLKDVEQEFIEMLKPTYNSIYAKGWDVERQKESNRKSSRKYCQSDKGKEYHRKYNQSKKGKEVSRKSGKKYYSQLVFYNGETMTLKTLFRRFQRAGVEHPTLEAKKYLI